MQTVRQAFTILKQNPLLSTISILGTAFAITMIMAIVIIWQTKYADLEPEVNRSRCLYFSAMHISSKTEEGVQNYNTPSPAFMKECIQPLSINRKTFCATFSNHFVSFLELLTQNELRKFIRFSGLSKHLSKAIKKHLKSYIYLSLYKP